MTDSGLTSRLRHQSRRTGLAVGLAMALTIAVCVGSFVIIYAQVDPFTRDFVAAPATSTPAPKPTSTKNDDKSSGEAAAGNTGNSNATQSSGNAPEPTATTEAAPTSTPNGFKADYHSNDETAVNFRSQPTTDSEVLLVLDAGTPMQSTGNKQTDDGGTVWMEFKLQDNTTGWIREIDAITEG
jgi:Bacterial SH3 domain